MTPQALLGLAALWCFWALWRGSQFRRLKIITVIDGDTYEAVSVRGKKYRLRLKGCDCPESDQPHGPESRDAVKEQLLKRWFDVRFHGKDKYRRYLVSIRVDGEDLASALLRAGMAYPMPGRFSRGAIAARLTGRGVWGGFTRSRPWEAKSRNAGPLRRALRLLRRGLSRKKPRRL